MTITAPPTDQSTSIGFATWFTQLYKAILGLQTSTQLPVYKLATLPTPSQGLLAFVSNATGGAIVAYGDGTNWRRIKDGTVVN